MNFINKLERKFGRLAIKNLIVYIIGMNGLVGIFTLMGYPVTPALALIPELVMAGQWWRLLTFVFIPPTFSLLWLFFILYLYYLIGTALEEEWGSFRFNLYYFLGICGTALAAFLTGTEGTPTYLNLSLFLAFARIYPNYELMLFFVLPIKIKYLAWLNWFFIGYTILVMPLAFKIAAIVSILNYFIFFGKEISVHSLNRQKIRENRKNFYNQIPQDHPMHRCVICGKTENDDPKLEFRYCAECAGDHEYCIEHLKNHDHIQS